MIILDNYESNATYSCCQNFVNPDQQQQSL
jgi:hypothetical protein